MRSSFKLPGYEPSPRLVHDASEAVMRIDVAAAHGKAFQAARQNIEKVKQSGDITSLPIS
jgi:hypothetical protein